MGTTPRQQQLLTYLREYVDEHGCAPTYKEIAARLDYRSLSTVHHHLRRLAEAGQIRMGYMRSRSIEVVASPGWEPGPEGWTAPPVRPPIRWLRERARERPVCPVPARMALPPGLVHRYRAGWEQVRERAESPDELWTFASGTASWVEGTGRAGFALLRGGRVVDGVLVWDQLVEPRPQPARPQPAPTPAAHPCGAEGAPAPRRVS